jgi:hypothetical protein
MLWNSKLGMEAGVFSAVPLRPLIGEKGPPSQAAQRRLTVNINVAFPSNYLKASDLADKTVPVTISHIDQEAVGRDKEMKPILYFEGKKKGLVLNRVNAKKVTDLAGTPETDQWPGVRIALYATMTEFGGEQVECIRIKAVPPQQAVKPVPVAKPKPAEIDPEVDEPLTADEIPF